MPQTSYTNRPEIGLPGQLFGTERPKLLTKQAEGNLPFGIAVTYGTAEKEVAAPSSGSDVIIGVVVRNMDKNTSHLSGTNQVEDGALHPVICEGMVYVEVEDAVTAGGQVFVRHTAAGAEVLGAFRSDADTSDAAALAGARYITSADAGELAVLQLNLPS